MKPNVLLTRRQTHMKSIISLPKWPLTMQIWQLIPISIIWWLSGIKFARDNNVLSKCTRSIANNLREKLMLTSTANIQVMNHGWLQEPQWLRSWCYTPTLAEHRFHQMLCRNELKTHQQRSKYVIVVRLINCLAQLQVLNQNNLVICLASGSM